MTEDEIKKQFDKTSRIMEKAFQVLTVFHQMSDEYYGIDYSDNGEESIIDAINADKPIINDSSLVTKNLDLTSQQDLLRTNSSRYGTSSKGVPYYVYYDLDSHGYRTATTSWKVRH